MGRSIKVLILTLIGFCCLLVFFSFPKGLDFIDGSRKSKGLANRFIFIYSGNSEYYKGMLKKGINKASEDLDVWVKFYQFNLIETSKHIEAFDMAIAAAVDGIITNIPASDEIKRYIEMADEKNIPVITIEDDMPSSKRISFIGTNSYTYGYEAGKLMAAATNGNARTAVFAYPKDNKQAIGIEGFKDAIRHNPNMSIEIFNITEPDIMGNANTAQYIFNNHPEIDSFFCISPEITIGVVQCMVEFNKMNNIVIGSGDSSLILKYIKKDIIYASLVENPYSIGYLAVKNLLQYKKGETISQLINPDVIVITKKNVDRVLKERKEE